MRMHTECEFGEVSTISIPMPALQPDYYSFETAVFDRDGWDVIETYDDEHDALVGHSKWVARCGGKKKGMLSWLLS